MSLIGKMDNGGAIAWMVVVVRLESSNTWAEPSSERMWGHPGELLLKILFQLSNYAEPQKIQERVTCLNEELPFCVVSTGMLVRFRSKKRFKTWSYLQRQRQKLKIAQRISDKYLTRVEQTGHVDKLPVGLLKFKSGAI